MTSQCTAASKIIDDRGLDQSVLRALTVLETLSVAGEPVRLSRLVAELGLSKSTTHRILKTLAAAGFVVQDEVTGRYGLSLKLWEMGSVTVVNHPIRRSVSAFVQALHKETNETVSLVVPDGEDVIYLEKLIAPRALRFSTRPGSRVSAPYTAGGTAILAHDPDAKAIVERFAARSTSSALFDPSAYLEELAEVRRRGYSVSRRNAGVVSVGSALLSKAGKAVAAISISAPVERALPESRLVEAVMSTCVRIVDTVGAL